MKGVVRLSVLGVLLLTSTRLQAVEPVLIDPWKSGNAAFECSQIDCDGEFAWKIDEQPIGSQVYFTDTDEFGNTPTDFTATILITNSNGVTFDWAMDYPVCAVIVKGSTGANVYYYDEGAYGDTGLHPPERNKDNDHDGVSDEDPVNGIDDDGDGLVDEDDVEYYDISHITFCFHDGDDELCLQEETAWAVGSRYVSRGSWAMYVTYNGDEQTIDIRAGGGDGVGFYAGTVKFSEPDGLGMVELTINLENSFIFYYDLLDPLGSANIKVQDYDTPPSGNPKVGLFAWKAVAPVGSTSYTIVVPANNYYGIHLDVAHLVSCDP